MLPDESTVVVAVAPKYAVFPEICVVDAFARVVSPLTERVPATETLPAESIVVVAVPPKYALVKTDCSEVEAAE